ncbi:MAG: carboxypeptidase regulatory-like domain-containing protein [Candidatus Altiarchaeota archaeon]
MAKGGKRLFGLFLIILLVNFSFCITVSADDRDFPPESSGMSILSYSGPSNDVTVTSGTTTTRKYRGYTGTGSSCIYPPGLHTVTFDISDINMSTITSAILTVRAYDCDNPTSGCDGIPEIDSVYFNGNYAGILTGATDQWSTVSFTIDPYYVINGTNEVLVFIDTLGTGCWCLGVDWAELEVEFEDIDLFVNGSEIEIGRIGNNRYEMISRVRNKGETDAENVNVRVIGTYLGSPFEQKIENVGTIAAGTFKLVTHRFTAFDIGNYKFEVIADPSNAIDETDENNNRGETFKVTGRMTETQSATNPLKRMKVMYQQQDGGNWVTKWTTFTDDNGDYAINLAMNDIDEGKPGRINGSLEFSPTKKTSNIKMRMIHETSWGDAVAKAANAVPISKEVSVANPLIKDRDYASKNLQYNAQEGGSTYHSATQAYLYWKQAPINFEIGFTMDCEIGDNDHTSSYYSTGTNTLHLHHTRLQVAQGWGTHSTSHEYGHRIKPPSDNFPYGPGNTGDKTKEDRLGENFANFASCLARNDGSPHGSAGWNHDMTTDTLMVEDASAWSLADVWWTLDRGPITQPGGNKVITTLLKSGRAGPPTGKDFFLNYTNDHPSVNVTWAKAVFRRHGFNVTTWKGRGGVDPVGFTGVFGEGTFDGDSDGLADGIIITAEVSISSDGVYYIYGYLNSEGSTSLCFAVNSSNLSSGIQNVSLIYPSSCIYANHLNGSLELRELYWETDDASLYEYLENPYNTSENYSFRNFDYGLIGTTGAISDSGTDTNASGKYNYLTVSVEVNVSEDGNYTLIGGLYDSDTNYIAFAQSTTWLPVGVQSFNLSFDGRTINANGRDGPYTVKGFEIYGNGSYVSSAYDPLQEQSLFTDSTSYTTENYNASDFESSGASFTGSTESVSDGNGNGLYDNLTVLVNATVSEAGTYSLIGLLTDPVGHTIMGIGDTFEFSSPGTFELVFAGQTIRSSGRDGPYNVTFTLENSEDIVFARGSYQTAAYSASDFETTEDSYVSIAYTDYGLDTDSDSFYNFLVVDMNISTNTNSSLESYTIQVIVYGQDGTYVSQANVNETLNNQTKNVIVNITGEDIWRAQISNGTYNVTINVFQNSTNFTLVTNLENDYTTNAYSFDEFQSLSAAFTGEYQDEGVDTDSDGYYNYLKIDVGINVSSNSTYLLMGYLYDINNSYIVGATNLSNLTNGVSNVSLYFEGVEIYDNSVDGSYNLKFLILYDVNNTQIGYRLNAYSTSAYGFDEFQGLNVTFTGNYTENATDTNNDSFFDTLEITVGVRVRYSGTYSINARLVDQTGHEIQWDSGSSYFNNNQQQSMALSFSGQYIYGNMVDGPYLLKNVYVYSTDTRSNSLEQAYSTTAYNYTEFQPSGIVHGYIKAENGTTIGSSIVSYGSDSDVTNASGYYKLSILVNQTNLNIHAGPPLGSNFFENSSIINISVGETRNLNFTLITGGILAGYVFDSDGSPVDNALVQISSVYYDYSDTDGSYTIPALTTGTKSITATPPDGPNLKSNSSSADVVKDQTTYYNITLPIGGSIAGQVIASNGSFVNYTYIYTSSSSNYSNASGHYNITRLSTGSYLLTANPPSSTNYLSNSTTVNVTLGQVTHFNMTVPVGGVISGAISFRNGTPIYNAKVVKSGPSSGTIYSNASGHYSFNRLTPGNYTMTVTPPSGPNLLSNSTTLEVSYGQVFDGNVTLPPGGILTGTVLAENGSSVYNALVYITGSGSANDYSDVNGTYLFERLNGTYNLTITPPGSGNYIENSSAGTVNVSSGQVVYYNITQPTGGMILGRVTDVNGNPVTSLSISLSGGPSSGSDSTNSSGHYEIIRLKTGTYNVTAAAKHSVNLFGNTTQTNVTAGQNTTLNLTLPQIPELYINSDTILDGWAKNLPDPETDGAIIINASHVTLDCNGSFIYGSNAGYGVYLNGKSNVTIRNCTFLNYSIGIYISSSSSNNIIEHNTVRLSETGLYYYYSHNDTIRNNSFNSNSDYGIYLYYSNYNEILENTASNNQDHGLYIYASNFNIISKNTAHSNQDGSAGGSDSAIYLYSSSSNTMTQNDLENHSEGTSDAGIYLYYSDRNMMTKNSIQSSNAGVYFYYSDHNEFMNNTLMQNDYGAYTSTGANNNSIFHNNFIGSTTTHAFDGVGNHWNLSASIGGNYYDNHSVTGNPSNGSQPFNVSGLSWVMDHHPFEDYFGWLIDDVPPQVYALQVSPNPIVNGVPVSISASVTDLDSEVSTVRANVSMPDASNELVGMSSSSPTYTGYFTSTDQIGNYTVRIVANDTFGNINATETASFEVVENITVTTTTNTTNGSTKIVYSSGTDTVLEITTHANVSNANVTVTVSGNDTTGNYTLLGLGKFITIEMDSELTDALDSVLIKFYYTDAELASSGLAESDLGIYRYNTTVSEWQLLNETHPIVNSNGINTEENYLWAEVTQLSTFTLGGGLGILDLDLNLETGWNLISLYVSL